MTLEERIEFLNAASASLQAQMNELNALREMVHRAEAIPKKIPAALARRGFSTTDQQAA